MSKHTQGRLHVAGQDKVQIRSDEHQIAKAWSFAGKTGQENARRLAACWNACEGLHTESLERNKPLGDQLVDAINQRDELLEALKQMVSIVVIHSNATGNNFAWAELDEARAAIAKCQ